MPPDDAVRLRHMVEALRDCQDFIAGRKRVDLDANRMLRLALVRAIEIVGEAAAKVSAETRNLYSQVPWAEIIGMRNRLIHAYFDINLDVLWTTATQDAPRLLALLQVILPPD